MDPKPSSSSSDSSSDVTILSSEVPDIIRRLESLEQESRRLHVPIIGPVKGAWLASFIEKHKPKLVLELGTANGYSGTILGHCGAQIVTIDIDHVIQERAKRTFAQFHIDAIIVSGDGVTHTRTLAAQSPQFDLVFIDFEKKRYLTVLEDCIKLTKTGGFLIADNVFMDRCKEYLDVVKCHPHLKSIVIDIGDGMCVSEVIRV